MDVPEVRELPRDLVFVDLETTGGNAARDRIIEIGIVRMLDGAAVEEWSTLVNPECRIPGPVEGFTGISSEMVATAPRFADIAALVLEKLRATSTAAGEPPVFAAHNARFDYGFLRAEFRRLSMAFSAKVLCTVRLSRRLFPEHVRHSLDAVMARHDLACSARHRALGDARVLGDFWRKLLSELPGERVAAAAHSVLATVKLPPRLPAGLVEELPEGPGVYRFFGADEVLLYVGRAACLRMAVLGHLGDDRGGRDRKLRDAVCHLEWEETAGELGAQLRELDCVRTRAPLYNRHARSGADAFTIRIAAGTGAASIQPIAEVAADDLETCFGVFNCAKDGRKALADIAAARQLCLKTLGLEERAGSCLGYNLGRCKGACAGKEPIVLHAVRVGMALAPLKLKPWPFPGRVALRERRAFDAADLHVVDRWRYIGTARSDEELAALAERPLPTSFDVPVYKILVRHFANHPRLDWHDLEARARIRDDGAYRVVDVS